MSEEEEGPCTDCWDTGVTIQTERRCACQPPLPVSEDSLKSAYLIRKNGYYYRPKAQGYTSSRLGAGRYTLEEAIRHSHPNGPDGPRDGITYEADEGAFIEGQTHE